MKTVLTLNCINVVFGGSRVLSRNIHRVFEGSVSDQESGLQIPSFINLVTHRPNGEGISIRDLIILRSDKDVFIDKDAPRGALPALDLPGGLYLAGLWDMHALVMDDRFRKAYLEIPELCNARVYALYNVGAEWGFHSRPGLKTWESARSCAWYRSEQCISDDTEHRQALIPFIRRGEFFLVWRSSTS